MRWIDIIYVDNYTPIMDIAWLDGTSLATDVVLSESSGIREDYIEWNDKDEELGNTYRHRMNPSQYTWTYLSEYDGPDGYVDNVGYGVAVRDAERNTLSSITISGSTYRDLGIENWTDWVPVFNPYTSIRNYLTPGQVMVYADVPEPVSGVTNHDMISAYVGPASVDKIYLGNEMIWRKQECSDSGLCGDYPNCHECTCEETYDDPADICGCEGRFWWDDECHDEPEPGPEEPCAGMEQDIADCVARGGEWDYVNCGCNEPEDPCEGYEEGSQEKCECEGRYWYADECHDEPESEPTCEEQGLCDDGEGNCVECEEEGCNGDPECECNEQGGTWDGEECQFE